MKPVPIDHTEKSEGSSILSDVITDQNGTILKEHAKQIIITQTNIPVSINISLISSHRVDGDCVICAFLME